MPVSCAASGCKSRYTLEAREKGITFHRFPRSNPALLDKWCRAMKRATSTGELWMPSRYQRLCSLHFQQSCFDTTGQTKRLRDDVIPSIFNFPADSQIKLLSVQKAEIPENKLTELPESSKLDIPILLSTSTEPDAENNTAPSTVVDTTVTCHVQLQDHPYFIPDIETLKRKLEASENSRAQKEKELRNAKDREKRLRQTCFSIYQELSKRNLLSAQLQETLQPYEDIPLELFRKPESEYSAQQRLFSLTIHLNDPLSYKYLRKEIKMPLPGPRRLCQWLKSDYEGPGINSSVIEALLEKKQTHPHLYTRVCLMVDTLSVQQNVVFNLQRNEFVGFVNFGSEARSQEVANEVLIFMLVGITGNWKSPVAYFFVKSLTAQAQKQLVCHTVYELCENGFEVVAISMERCPRNEEMCCLLGCSFTEPWNLQTCFSLPNQSYKHYVIFDISCELTTVTNMVEELGSIQSPDGIITWQYITEMMTVARSSRTIPHLAKMSLVVNKLSNTVANALKLIQDLKTKEYDFSHATVHFIQIIGQLFDIFNSSSVRLKDDKGPINHSNLEQKLQILQEAREYLLTLTTCDNNFLFQTASAWYTLGLLVNINSLAELLPHLLMEQEYVITHRFSMHHLKEFRSLCHKGGSSGIPTALEARCAIEKLWSQSGLVDTCEEMDWNSENAIVSLLLSSPGQKISSPFVETIISWPDHAPSRLLGGVLYDPEVYIAGWIVRKAFRKLACNKCRWALVKSPRYCSLTSAYHLLQVQDGSVYFVPSVGTIRTVQTVERELRHLLNCGDPLHSISELWLQHHVLLTLGSEDLFYLQEHIIHTEQGIDNHHFLLLRFITSLYYGIRKPFIDRTTLTHQHRTLVKQTLSSSLHV
ncbi:DNA transposase THAP9 [Gastrophryne carolinensis]